MKVVRMRSENMSKYDIKANSQQMNIEAILTEGENVIWKGRPKKSAFIINKVMVMLPFALLWLLFDTFVLVALFASEGFEEIVWFVIPFFLFHLMPVWIWLSNALTAKKRWENTQYVMTDKRIVIQSGFIGMDYKSIYYKDIVNVRLKVGVIDKLLHVGDIYFDTNTGFNNNGANLLQAFLDIEDVYELYPKIQKVVLDIQTDIEYPNELRPEINRGYNTEYKGKF